MADRLISVITVAYNSEALLKKAFDGIAGQTYKDFEYVFVDNGSTDKTGQLIDDFSAGHPDIEIKKCRIEVNEGLSKGRNAGLDLAAGEYVFFHDADDWMDPDCLESLVRVANSSHPSRIIQQVRYIDDDGKYLDELFYSQKPSGWLKNSLQGDLFKRDVITTNKIRFDKDVFTDDVFFTCLFSSFASDAEFLRETHYNMLVHNASTTHKESSRPGYFQPLLEKSFNKMQMITDRVRDTADYDLYEYSIMELYYGFVFHGKNMSLKQKLKEYDDYKKIMKKYYPHYLKNKNVKLFSENGYGGHFKRNIWISFQCEKFDRFIHAPLAMTLLISVFHLALRLHIYKALS